MCEITSVYSEYEYIMEITERENRCKEESTGNQNYSDACFGNKKHVAAPMIKLKPANTMVNINSSPRNVLYAQFIPPSAATICGITINILNIPIETPIFSGLTDPANMAYGIDKILPHDNPINPKLRFRICA